MDKKFCTYAPYFAVIMFTEYEDYNRPREVGFRPAPVGQSP